MKVNNYVAEQRQKELLKQHLQKMRDELRDLNTSCHQYDTALAWALNQKMRMLERVINDLDLGIDLFFGDGELYG